MKTKVLTIAILTVLLLSGCGLIKPSGFSDLQATNVDLVIKSTVMAGELETMGQVMTQIALQPTATCPVCPTAEPCPTSIPATATPGVQPTFTPTAVPTGSISGALSYPSEYIPAQRVLAYNFTTGYYYWLNTNEGQSTYTLNNIPVGKYWVLSYLIKNPSDSLRAAYSNNAVCMVQNLTTNCGHELVAVEVKAGEETTGINIWDWYNPDPNGSGWPTDPTQK